MNVPYHRLQSSKAAPLRLRFPCDVNFVWIWLVQTSFERSFPRDTKDQTPPCFNFSFPGIKFVCCSYLLFYLQVQCSFCRSLPRDSEHRRVPIILVSLVLNSLGLPSCSFLYRFKPVFVNWTSPCSDTNKDIPKQDSPPGSGGYLVSPTFRSTM